MPSLSDSINRYFRFIKGDDFPFDGIYLSLANEGKEVDFYECPSLDYFRQADYDVARYLESFKEYCSFFNELNCQANRNGINLNWCSNDKIMDTEDKRVIALNIQFGEESFWEKVTTEILNNVSNNTRYLFYYLTTDEKQKEDFEYNDKLWGYSRFIRDFLLSQKLAIEVNVRKSSESYDEYAKKIFAEIMILPGPESYLNFEKLKKNIVLTLTKIFGDEFAKLKGIKNIEKLCLSGYTYNKNKFADKLADLQKSLFSEMPEISEVSSHQIFRSIETHLKTLLDDNKTKNIYFQNLGVIEFWNHFRRTMSPMLRAVINYREPKLTFLFIDDNEDYLKEILDTLKLWFPESEFNYTEKFKIDQCLESSKSIIEYQLELKNQGTTNIKTIKEINPDFIIVDLEYEGQLKGFEILARLRNGLKDINERIQIIVLSRYEEPYIIRKSISCGALFYVTKSNYLRLIDKVYQIDKQNVTAYKNHNYYENWSLLNKLEPSKIIGMKSCIINGESLTVTSDMQWNVGSAEYRWIKKLPKADLHCHIGSCLGPDLLPKTAFLVLAEKFNREKGKSEEKIEYAFKKIKEILKYLFPIVFDPYLNKLESFEPFITSTSNNILKDIQKYSELFKSGKKRISLFEAVDDVLPLRNINKPIEEIVLSPNDKTIEELFRPLSNLEGSLYYKRKNSLRELKVSYDEVMLYYILLLALRYGIINRSLDIQLERIKEYIKNNLIEFENTEVILHSFVENLKTAITEYLDESGWKFNKDAGSKNVKEIEDMATRLIKSLQSANSIERCLKDGNRGLFNYLRGCEYGGAAHLQTEASIWLAANYILNEYAVKDNIRYLTLRCAVDGYSKFGMIQAPDAIKSLIESFDYYCRRSSKKNHVDFILTAKRHKQFSDFDKNVSLALESQKNSKGSGEESPEVDSILTIKRHKQFSDSDENVSLALESQKNSKGSGEESPESVGFFASKPRIVSFDLAGLEKGNRVSKFKANFEPLLKNCFPITIHAGEEDDSDAIWEAVYLAHTQRIGHALTLNQKPRLRDIVSERQIAIELCPISNYLTSENYTLEPEKIKNNLKAEYPLKEYLNNNVIVTVNTDNPFVSDSNLTKEFIFLSRISGGLTKWEILKLIKNSFKSASIPKKEKRQLMDEIDEEIFEILSKEKEL